MQPLLRNVSTGILESDSLEPYFTEYVHSIYRHFAVNGANRYYWRYVSTHISRTGYVGNNLLGFNCLKYGTRCMADNRDCQYFVTWPDVQILSNSSIFLLIGVSHRSTGKAKWENVVPMFQDKGFHHKFYRSHYLHLIPEQYTGSAVAFPPGIDTSVPKDVLDKLFVIAAMRPAMCQQYFDAAAYPELHDIPKFCFDGNDFGYNESGKFFFVHRNYVDSKSRTRPAAEEMIPMMVMQFDAQWFDFNTA